jgi:hypothetical protein
MMRSLGIAIFIVGVSAALLGTGGVLSRWHVAPWAASGLLVPGEAVAIAQPFYSFDPSDDQALTTYATDIFVGRVLGKIGAIGAPTSAPGQEVPQTQYAVEVVETIKGDAAEVVTVNQVGGVDASAGRPMMLAGDAPLRPGTSELFLTVAVPERGWYQIAAGGFGHLAADDLTRREVLVARFSQPAGETPVGAAPQGLASSVTSSQADLASIDFITFNGAVYLSAVYLAEDSPIAPYAPIGLRDLGPAVGEVVTNWVDGADALAYPNEPCSWDSPDGTAPRLSPGDEIYAVRGYATTFRVAARHAGELVAYQVWCSDDAEVGADLFDIYDRVVRISVTEDLSESSGWATIDDPATVAGLVWMLLEGAVIPEDLTSTEPITHQMIVHLEDGTTFRASAAPGEFIWGLGAVEVPKAFTDMLHEAWQTHLDAS